MDLATLGFRVDTRQTKGAKKDLDQMAVAAQNAKNEADDLGTASQRAGAGARRGAGGFRNLGLQLNQVAQQGAVTGNYMQAMAIQLPDMLLGFGGLGIAIGIAAGALTPFIMGMIDSTDSIDSMAEAIDDVGEFLASYAKAAELARMSTGDLVEEFGRVDEAFRAVLGLQAELAGSKAQRAIDGLAESLSNLFDADDAQDARADVAAFFDLNIFGAFTRAGKEAVRDARRMTGEFVAAQNALMAAEGNLGAQISATQDLIAATRTLVDLDGERTEEEEDLLQVMIDTLESMQKQRGEVEKSNTQIDMMMEAAESVAIHIGNAADNASTLWSNMTDAASAAWDFVGAMAERSPEFISRQNKRDSMTYSGRGGAPTQNVTTLGGDGIQEIIDRETKKTRGGAQKKHNEALREAERIFDQTRTAAENYTLEIGGLNTLLQQGLIDQETFSRAAQQAAERYGESFEGTSRWTEIYERRVEALRQDLADGKIDQDEFSAAVRQAAEDYKGASEAADFFKDTAGNAFIDLAMGASTFGEAMQQVAASIARAAFEAALFGNGPMAGLFGGSGGGIFGVLGFAKGTDYAPGGLAMVGEDGPELVNLPRGSRVHTAEETKRMLASENARDLERMVTNPQPMAAAPSQTIVQNTNVITFDAREARKHLLNSPDGQADLVKIMAENERA